jgi:predicted ATPase
MITQILFHPEFAKERGLRGGKLERLGRVVILAGPNGSGKSRYLQFVQDIFSSDDLRGIADIKASIDYSQREVSSLQSQLSRAASPEAKKLAQEWITKNEQSIHEDECWLEVLAQTHPTPQPFKPLPQPYKPSRPLILLSYPADNLGVGDARQMSPAYLKEAAQRTSNVGFEHAYSGMHAYCTQIAQAMYHSEHPRMMKQEEVAQQRQDAQAFNAILRALLDEEIEFTIEGTEVLPTLRNRPLEVAELSTGERLLLTWAISLHRQREGLSNAIVLLDEPESHLHHDACIRALTKLRDEVLGPEGQIWLATHSVPLLAWGGLDSVHFVKDGAIQFAGNKVTTVVESLLGGREGRDRLGTFLSDADEVAFTEFAAQCVLPAGVADPKTGDKQQAQFIEVVHQRLATHEQLRLLDFSAGKGRFASALHERFATSEGKALQGRIEYLAYNDPQFTEPEVREACKARIAALGQSEAPERYYWESLSQLQATHGQSIHLVILSNVLHEIEPESWLKVFRAIDGLLAPDGALVVMEDLLPPVGELPNKRGYLLLDEYGLGQLFGDSKGVKVLQKREERLLAVEIPKRLVSGVTKETREAALRYLQEHSKEQVGHLRKQAAESPSHRLGREHAHYAMLYTNASLALELLR